MKTIYVLKDFMGFKGITEEEANQGIKERKYGGVEFIIDRGDDEIKIVLLESAYLLMFGLSDEQIEKLTKEYFDYVESITGMVTYLKP